MLPTADTPQEWVKVQYNSSHLSELLYSRNETLSSHSGRKPLVLQRTFTFSGRQWNGIAMETFTNVKQGVVWPTVALQKDLSLCQRHWISLIVCFKLSGLLIVWHSGFKSWWFSVRFCCWARWCWDKRWKEEVGQVYWYEKWTNSISEQQARPNMKTLTLYKHNTDELINNGDLLSVKYIAQHFSDLV